MKRSRIIVVFCLLAAAVLVWWLMRSLEISGKPMVAQHEETKTLGATPAYPTAVVPLPSSPAEAEQKKKQALERVTQAFTAPIAFYGKVIDQYGDPVPDAEVGYTAADKFNASGSNYTGKSDAQGLFEISGIQGAGLGVAVRKAGYYFVDEGADRSSASSAATFAYGMGPDSYCRIAPTKDKPAIFLLHKMGETEPLVHVSGRQYKVAKNGQPMEVNLETGGAVAAGQGDIRFERWASDQAKNERGHFDWRFQITVPGGGIIERDDQFAFEAPADKYQDAVEISMPASLADKWSYTVNKSYFIKTREGYYARINATIYGGHNNSLVLESFVNPTPGNRNLEFDPAKVVKSP